MQHASGVMFQGCDPFELPSAGVGSMIDIKMKNLIAFPPQSGRWQDGTLDLKLHSLIYISELQTQADVTIVKLPLKIDIVGNNSIRNWGGILQYSKLSVSNNAPLCYITLLCKVQIIDNSQQ